jgi:hypothetical protein
MARRGRIHKKNTRIREEISPMESMVNLVDVMLVFICGLLISIIAYWNIDMDNLVTIINQQQMVRIDDPQEITEHMGAFDGYSDVGSAILDPKSGDVYVLDDQE